MNAEHDPRLFRRALYALAAFYGLLGLAAWALIHNQGAS